MSDPGRPTVHHSKLPETRPGDALHQEWCTYRREAARLLAEGHEGKFALIKGAQVVGLYGAWDAAREAGLRLYLLQPFLVQEVRSEEPVLRLRGYALPCPG